MARFIVPERCAFSAYTIKPSHILCMFSVSYEIMKKYRKVIWMVNSKLEVSDTPKTSKVLEKKKELIWRIQQWKT